MSEQPTNHKEITALIKRISGQANFIGTPRIYVDMFNGDIVTAVWFNQCVFRDGQNTEPIGFHRTYEQWRTELGLSEYQVRRSARLCKALGLIEVTFAKVYGTPKNHYLVIWPELLTRIQALLTESEPVETKGSEPVETKGSNPRKLKVPKRVRKLNVPYIKRRRLLKSHQEEEENPLAVISKKYEEEFGPLTPLIADKLKDYADTYPLKWVTDAMSEAVSHNARNCAYFEAILKRWKRQGNQEPAKQRGANSHEKRTGNHESGTTPAQHDDESAKRTAALIRARRSGASV